MSSPFRSLGAQMTGVFIAILCFSCLVSAVVVLGSAALIHGLWPDGPLAPVPVLIGLAAVLCAVLGSVLVFFAARTLTRPLGQLGEAARQVSQGRFEVDLNLRGPQELTDLADHFRRMIRELGALEAQRRDFVAQVSHELKTPVAAIHGYAQLLSSPDLPEAKAQAYLAVLRDESLRLTRLSSHLLRLSRLDHQTIGSAGVRFSLDEQLRRTLVLLEDRWSAQDLELDLDLEAVEVVGDEDLVQQVWINLLDNAVKFSPPRGRLGLSLAVEGSWARVRITDQGPGIPAEDGERIFERFYRGWAGQADDGHGLGLAIVHKIAEVSGARIRWESPPAGGTCFEVLWPLHGVPSEALAGALARAQQGELDAVVLYRGLAALTRRPDWRETFLALAADEGRHAAVYRDLTGLALTPAQDTLRKVRWLWRLAGGRRTLRVLARNEAAAALRLRPLADRYPRVAAVAADEERHARILADLARA